MIDTVVCSGAWVRGVDKAISGSILGAVIEHAASERLGCRTNKLGAVTEQAAAEKLRCRANKMGTVTKQAARNHGAARSEKAAGNKLAESAKRKNKQQPYHATVLPPL
jgi:hypothetical protein